MLIHTCVVLFGRQRCSTVTVEPAYLKPSVKAEKPQQTKAIADHTGNQAHPGSMMEIAASFTNSGWCSMPKGISRVTADFACGDSADASGPPIFFEQIRGPSDSGRAKAQTQKSSQISK
jgi:hypothetical protein